MESITETCRKVLPLVSQKKPVEHIIGTSVSLLEDLVITSEMCIWAIKFSASTFNTVYLFSTH
jgi:hypothetical protein